VTSGHKILTHKGWVQIKDIKTSNLVAILDRFNFPKLDSIVWDKNLSFTCVLSVKIKYYSKVYDAWVPGAGNFICNDIVVHNSIEQDADVVLMLYRESYYSSSAKESGTEIIIAKQRNGPIGSINLIVDAKLVSFSNFVLLD
jgi:replicative DNA helicase